MRSLSAAVAGDRGPSRALFADPAAFDAWAARWRERRAGDDRDADEVAAAMDRVNPVVHPAQPPRRGRARPRRPTATSARSSELLDVVTRPFDERPGLDAYRQPAPADGGRYVTFCGT